MSTNADDLPDPEAFPPPQTPTVTSRKSISSRTGYAWVGLVAGALILIILLIFILQNLESIRVSLFFWEFNLPIGVAVLLSVIGGALVMALVGGVRIMQLRRAAKH
ncbi:MULTISPECIES: LapA family protein [Nocardia]|uniref:Lipopolysaccharide assembly protein LapA domain-containing protein n=1 Tax=Nocardia aurea TaxID=2144174 RepID=A0ABV3G4X7_9NOCA|nr:MULTISPECIES: lipopolysaccharide assembly protein LapA domain-containing protein [Nocardia]